MAGQQKLKFKEWLLEMGYDGNISQSVLNLVDDNTSTLWSQLMRNVKPKGEIEQARLNVASNTRSTTTCVIPKEIEVSQRKQLLQSKLAEARENMRRNKHKIGMESLKCKVNFVKHKNLEREKKENQQKTYLLEAKKVELAQEVEKAKENLMLAKNLIPKRPTEHADRSKIKENLKMLGEDLVSREKIARDMLRNNNREVVAQCFEELNDDCCRKLDNFRLGALREPSAQVPDNSNLLNCYAVHLKYELNARTYDKSIKNLETEIAAERSRLYGLINNLPDDEKEKIKRHVELQVKDAGSKAELEMIQSLIESNQTSSLNECLKTLEKELKSVRDLQEEKLSEARGKIDLIQSYSESLEKVVSEARAFVNELVPEVNTDTTSCKNIFSREIETFMDFPLEFNKKKKDSLSDPTIYDGDCDESALCMLAELLGNPATFGEITLKNLTTDKEESPIPKHQINDEAACLSEVNDIAFEEPVAELLKIEDLYTHKMSDKLQAMRQLEINFDFITGTSNFWAELPFGNFISDPNYKRE